MKKAPVDILEKIISLYEKYGIKSITMDDVARELGISKKTLYQYVADKADLVEQTMLVMLQMQRSFFDQLIEKKLNAIDELLEVNKYLNDMLKFHNASMEYDLKKYYPAIRQKILSQGRMYMMEGIKSNLRKGIAEGLYRKDVNVEIIAKLMLFRNEAICENDLFSREEILSEGILKEIFTYHIRGIASSKGIKFFEDKVRQE